jgi:hypothetical protein
MGGNVNSIRRCIAAGIPDRKRTDGRYRQGVRRLSRRLNLIDPLRVSVDNGNAVSKTPHLEEILEALEDAGFQIYRADETEIRLAERVRLHIMDSGVRVRIVASAPQVSFSVRAQRSDFPRTDAATLFERIRETSGASLRQCGFAETGTETRDVTDPMDEERILDVWYEITYAKLDDDLRTLVDDIRWALAFEKCLAG